MIGGDDVACAVGVGGVVSVVVGIVVRVGVAGVVPSIERVDGSNGREEAGDNEAKPKDEVAANVRAWVYGVGAGDENADICRAPDEREGEL